MTQQNPKYRVIAKVSKTKLESGQDHCVKYRTSNLIDFANFLDSQYPEWCWFNVFRYVKGGKGDRLASFTKYNRPTAKTI